MAETKYGKYVIKDPVIDGPFTKSLAFNGHEHFPELGYWIRWHLVPEPNKIEKPHSHDFDQIFHTFGADSSDITDFQAEIEFHIGEEEEIHVITSPTIIYIPAGLVHCPVNFKRVDKPFVWMNVALVRGEYWKTLTTGERAQMPPGT